MFSRIELSYESEAEMIRSSDKIVVEVGFERKKAFKSKLYAEGNSIKNFIIDVIDKYLKKSEVKENG